MNGRNTWNDFDFDGGDYDANSVSKQTTELNSKATEFERNSTYPKMFKNVYDTIFDGLLGDHQIEKFKDPERQKLHDAVKDVPVFGDAVRPVNAYLQVKNVPLAEEATEIFIEQSQLYKKAKENGNTDARLDPSDLRKDAHLEAKVAKAFADNNDSDGAFIHRAVSGIKHFSIFSDSINHHDEAHYFCERGKSAAKKLFGYKLTKGEE